MFDLTSPEGYRYAQQVGEQLFVAGQVPLDTKMCVVGVDNPKAQARQCLDNLQNLIQRYDFDVTDIRQIVVYVTGEKNNLTAAWHEVVSWFGGETPPATLLGVSNLGYDHQIVEIDATVMKNVEMQT